MGKLRRRIVVIGLGEFGSHLVTYLYKEGHEVMAIDVSMERVELIKDECTVAVSVDCTDEKAMSELDLGSFDTAIIAISTNFETVLVACDILKKLGINEIIARYRTDLQKRILGMLGITQIFNPEERAAANMAEMFRHEGVKESILLGDDFRILKILCPTGLVGVRVKDLTLLQNYHLKLVTVRRHFKRKGEKKVLGSLSPETTLNEGDELILFGKTEDLDNFLDSFS